MIRLVIYTILLFLAFVKSEIGFEDNVDKTTDGLSKAIDSIVSPVPKMALKGLAEDKEKSNRKDKLWENGLESSSETPFDNTLNNQSDRIGENEQKIEENKSRPGINKIKSNQVVFDRKDSEPNEGMKANKRQIRNHFKRKMSLKRRKQIRGGNSVLKKRKSFKRKMSSKRAQNWKRRRNDVRENGLKSKKSRKRKAKRLRRKQKRQNAIDANINQDHKNDTNIEFPAKESKVPELAHFYGNLGQPRVNGSHDIMHSSGKSQVFSKGERSKQDKAKITNLKHGQTTKNKKILNNKIEQKAKKTLKSSINYLDSIENRRGRYGWGGYGHYPYRPHRPYRPYDPYWPYRPLNNNNNNNNQQSQQQAIIISGLQKMFTTPSKPFIDDAALFTQSSSESTASANDAIEENIVKDENNQLVNPNEQGEPIESLDQFTDEEDKKGKEEEEDEVEDEDNDKDNEEEEEKEEQ